jgi:hypothetical protein
MRLIPSMLALALAATPAVAQEHGADHRDNAVQGGGTLPAGWTARADNNRPLTNLKFEVMAPGHHVTTGPAAIVYREADRADGAFHAVAKMHLFPGSGHHEAFGLFLGGQNLQAANQSYTYFLIRGDGQYTIKRRKGSDVTTVVDWTPSDAIVKGKAEGSVANELSLEAGRDSVTFMVNGKTVATLPASQVDARGVVGFRINHNLNLHIEDLGVHPR